jgi:hypothetical protein
MAAASNSGIGPEYSWRAAESLNRALSAIDSLWTANENAA